MTTKRTTWTELKAELADRLDTDESRRRRRAIRVAMTVAQRMYDLRTARGWSEGDLAARMGMEPETVEQLEQADIPLDLDLLHRLSQALGVRLVINFIEAEADDRQPAPLA